MCTERSKTVRFDDDTPKYKSRNNTSWVIALQKHTAVYQTIKKKSKKKNHTVSIVTMHVHRRQTKSRTRPMYRSHIYGQYGYIGYKTSA